MTYRMGIVLLLLLHATTGWAGEYVEPCKEIRWTPDNVYFVRSKLHVATHIILPEPMQGKPVAGDGTLWSINGENIHLFIQPKTSKVDEGAQTSASVVSTSNTSYDFLIERVYDAPDVCIKLVREGRGQTVGTQGWQTPQQRAERQLQQQLTQAQQSIVSLRKVQEQEKAKYKQQVLKTLAEYRTKIYTGYIWEGESRQFGDTFISDVYDDGRFTFIRVTHDNQGLMQLQTRIEDKKEMLEYTYDAGKKIYTVVGIYPELLLTYDETTMEIHRKTSQTWGGY